MKNLKEIRENKGLTQVEVAKALGISKQAYNNYEHGRREADYEMLLKLAEFFNTSVENLLTGEIPAPSNAMAPDSSTVHYRPVFNSVSAGFGVYADSDVVGFLPLIIMNPYDVENTICINVRGDSMYPKIEDGDTVIVRKQDTVEYGQIGVVLVGDEGFVKRVEFGDDFIRLVSTNPEFPPKTFRGADLDNVRIVGLVKQIIKNV